MRASSLLQIASLISSTLAAYVVDEDYGLSSFFDKFDFFTDPDPTHGYVQYVDQGTAQTSNLININGGSIYIGVDHQNIALGPGRKSVRITSKKSYNHGLVILDLQHTPGGICGTWPAFWLVGPEWPSNGEIDIIEGVNSQDTNSVTLHTNAGCSIKNDGRFFGTMRTSNCDVAAPGQAVNAGCQINSPNKASYGAGFNAQGGGVYAMEWTSNMISVWFFPRSVIPADIASGQPQPTTWGQATAAFSGDCDIDKHFKNQQIVFDTTFCGDWASNVWSSDPICASKASTCQAFVQNNPTAFTNAYWLINSLKVYQQNGAAETSIVPLPTTNTTAIAASTQAISHTRPHSQQHYSQTTSTLIVAPAEATNTPLIVSAIPVVIISAPDAKLGTAEPDFTLIVSTTALTATEDAPLQLTSPPSETTLLPQLPVLSLSLILTTTTATATITLLPVPLILTATSTLSDEASHETLQALDAFDFPSGDEVQTAGVPVVQAAAPSLKKRRRIHRHMLRHQRLRKEK